ncbi:sigma factor G inhibitor Gin [Halalkalibacillus halophilus]|uniref:sigma factor G inhibitor Gin n=1 Tax=Halalkalibacillus halophilus TaxID=392827 RepID=UPI000414C37C|nr:sigma factor G inhibitor Gin [Halalkalibacillus halophilus]
MGEQTTTCCQICENWKGNGFYLLDAFICKDCEHLMVNTSPDQEIYSYFIERLKERRMHSYLM